jgi:hypothetical protein
VIAPAVLEWRQSGDQVDADGHLHHCIEQLPGTAGARQVTVRAETALGAFTRQAGGIMFGRSPSAGDRRLAGSLLAQSLSLNAVEMPELDGFARVGSRFPGTEIDSTRVSRN